MFFCIYFLFTVYFKTFDLAGPVTAVGYIVEAGDPPGTDTGKLAGYGAAIGDCRIGWCNEITVAINQLLELHDTVSLYTL